MNASNPRHPLLRAILSLGSVLWYLFQWRRDKKRAAPAVVDATATVIDTKDQEMT